MGGILARLCGKNRCCKWNNCKKRFKGRKVKLRVKNNTVKETNILFSREETVVL